MYAFSSFFFVMLLTRWRTVDVKGFDSTIGYTQWANKPAEQDAAVRFPNLPLPSRLSLAYTHIFYPAHPYRPSRRSAQQAP